MTIFEFASHARPARDRRLCLIIVRSPFSVATEGILTEISLSTVQEGGIAQY
jgi:hypothetical protein